MSAVRCGQSWTAIHTGIGITIISLLSLNISIRFRICRGGSQSWSCACSSRHRCGFDFMPPLQMRMLMNLKEQRDLDAVRAFSMSR